MTRRPVLLLHASACLRPCGHQQSTVKPFLRLDLVGEPQPIEVELERYSLTGKGTKTQLTIEETTGSREWLAVALREFVVGQSFSPGKNGGFA